MYAPYSRTISCNYRYRKVLNRPVISNTRSSRYIERKENLVEKLECSVSWKSKIIKKRSILIQVTLMRNLSKIFAAFNPLTPRND